MLKQTIQRLEGSISISASRRSGDAHMKMKWKNHLFGNWVRSISSTTQSTNRTTWHSVPKERVECVVIGAGVVGIAIARALALKGREVLVVESAPTFGTGTSSRNSEVIHAGIYYPRNSFKAIFCVRGREMLYEYCSKHDIPHKQIGKLIVATRSSEIPKLNDIFKLWDSKWG